MVRKVEPRGKKVRLVRLIAPRGRILNRLLYRLLYILYICVENNFILYTVNYAGEATSTPTYSFLLNGVNLDGVLNLFPYLFYEGNYNLTKQ